MLPALHDSIHLLICPSAICIQKGHVSVPAVSSVVSIIEKSDRNCPERAECTSVRISLMGLLYRNYLEKSTMILNGIFNIVPLINCANYTLQLTSLIVLATVIHLSYVCILSNNILFPQPYKIHYQYQEAPYYIIH